MTLDWAMAPTEADRYAPVGNVPHDRLHALARRATIENPDSRGAAHVALMRACPGTAPIDAWAAIDIVGRANQVDVEALERIEPTPATNEPIDVRASFRGLQEFGNWLGKEQLEAQGRHGGGS